MDTNMDIMIVSIGTPRDLPTLNNLVFHTCNVREPPTRLLFLVFLEAGNLIASCVELTLPLHATSILPRLYRRRVGTYPNDSDRL